jgi:hypothetical protein
MNKFLHSPTGRLLVSGLLVLATPAVGQAQVFDHLTCFKAKDSQKIEASVTLDALQGAFGPSSPCTVKGKAKLFCSPVSKTVQSLLVNGEGAAPLNVGGQDLAKGSICYKVKCPKKEIGEQELSDQFGTRRLSKFKTALLCTPAIQGPPTTTTTLGPSPSCGAPCGIGEACCDPFCVTDSDVTCGPNCEDCSFVGQQCIAGSCQ